jgi:CelD/BcsL family acetyltransferase involved in cellulose biosynthesis
MTAVVETIQRVAELEALRDEWNALADIPRSPLLRHEWLTCCARAFCADGDLRVVTVRQAGQLIAAAPLTARRRFGTSRLELLGMAALNEPSGFLAVDDRALQTLVGAVIGLKMPVLLQRIADDSAVPACLQAMLPRSSVLRTGEGPGYLSVPVSTAWTDYYKTLSSRITGNLKRVKAKSKALGAAIAIHTPSESEVGSLLRQLVQVEGSGWKGRRGSALSSNTPLRTFFEQYSLRAAREGILRVATLRFGDEVAAMELAVVAYQRWWQLKIGYADAFAKHYPGLQLTEATLRYAFDLGLESFEFLGSPAAWETSWRPLTKGQRMAAVYPASVIGFQSLLVDFIQALQHRTARISSRIPTAERGVREQR